MDKGTHQQIMSFLQHIPNAQPQPKTVATPYIPSMVSAFLSEDSLPLSPQRRPMSPPLFPRQGNKVDVPGLQKLSDVPSFGLIQRIKVEEEVEDRSAMHMLLVDGWSRSMPFRI